MRQYMWLAVGVVGMIGLFAMAEDQPSAPARIDRKAKHQTQVNPGELVARTYNVADFVQPQGTDPAQTVKPRFDDILSFIRRETDAKSWERDDASMKPYPATLSLIIRQTSDVHERIAEKLGELRTADGRKQVMIQMALIAGPRRDIVALAARFDGEFGQHEREQLLDAVQNSETLEMIGRPQVRTLNQTTVSIHINGKAAETICPVLALHPIVADDRRAIQLKLAAARNDGTTASLSSVHLLALHDGRTAAVHFESDRVIPSLPPADDAQELLILVTPRIVREKEEAEHVLMLTPRGGISDEEEELLGIPVVEPEAGE